MFDFKGRFSPTPIIYGKCAEQAIATSEQVSWWLKDDLIRSIDKRRGSAIILLVSRLKIANFLNASVVEMQGGDAYANVTKQPDKS